jgi:hypothetical protein
MSEQPHIENRPESDQPLDPAQQPAAGGTDDGEPAQGDGAPDSH